MLQYIFFIYNSTIKESNEESNVENNCNLYLNQEEYFLERDFTKIYNLQYFGQDDTRGKKRTKNNTHLLFHPHKKPKLMLNESESYEPLDLSNKATNLTQKLEENIQNDLLKNESEKSLSENNTNTLQNLLETISKHFDAGEKEDSNKTNELLIKKNLLDIIADEILKFQNTLLENNQNEIFYNRDIMQKFQELQKSYQTKDLKEKLKALNFFIEKEIVYEEQFIKNFLKTYKKSIQEKNYKSPRYRLIRWKNKTHDILSSQGPYLIKIISESSLDAEMKAYVLDYIEFIKIRLEHIIKLIPDYRLKSENIIKLLYWYMRFINEKNIFDKLFDLVGLRKEFFKKNIPVLLTNDAFRNFNNCLTNCLDKENYAKSCVSCILG